MKVIEVEKAFSSILVIFLFLDWLWGKPAICASILVLKACEVTLPLYLTKFEHTTFVYLVTYWSRFDVYNHVSVCAHSVYRQLLVDEHFTMRTVSRNVHMNAWYTIFPRLMVNVTICFQFIGDACCKFMKFEPLLYRHRKLSVYFLIPWSYVFNISFRYLC